jgi:hypothetical protein
MLRVLFDLLWTRDQTRMAAALPTPALRQEAKERAPTCVGNARKIKKTGLPTRIAGEFESFSYSCRAEIFHPQTPRTGIIAYAHAEFAPVDGKRRCQDDPGTSAPRNA